MVGLNPRKFQPTLLCLNWLDPFPPVMNAQTLLKNLKASPLFLPIGGTIALIAGGSIAFWAITRSNFAPGTLPIGSNVIPEDALMVMSTTTEPGQWKQLRAFGTQKSQEFLDQNIAQVRDRFLFDNGLDYERDIQPWVGREVSFALLSPQGETQLPADGASVRPANPQPALLMLPIEDAIKAKEVLGKYQGAQQWTKRIYKDVEIQEGQVGKANKTLSIAALDGKLVVVANSPRAIEQAIETYKGSNAIATLPGYSSALGQIQTGPSFSTVYLNLPAMAQQGGRSVRPNPKKDMPIQGWAMTTTLQNEGIQMKSVLWLKPDSQTKFSTDNNAKTMATRLPADSVMTLAGGSFKQFWTDYSRDYATNPIKLLDPASFKQEIRGAIGMDLEQDFANWMDGEFSLALLPVPSGSSPLNPVGVTMMVQASDRRAAEKALTQLDETMGRKYNFKIEPNKVANQDVVLWKMANGETSVTRGWLDNNIAFLTLGGPVAATFLPRPANPLTSQPMFKQVTADPKMAKSGEIFIDLEKAATYKDLPLLRSPLSNLMWTEAIRSIGITTANTSDRTIRYDAIVLLKKGATPGVLPSPTAQVIPLPPKKK